MKVLIIEDEYHASSQLMGILNDVEDTEVVGVIESISETVEWFRKNQLPDLVFMDIHLADGSAFEIFKKIDIICPIIFTTAFDEYALDAFKVNSIDYLLKPVDKKMIVNALKKLRRLSDSNKTQSNIIKLLGTLLDRPAYRTHYLVPDKGDRLVPLLTREIAYIYVDNGIVKVRTFDEKTFFPAESLNELAHDLNPHDFFRANRQFIISRDSISTVNFWFNNRLSITLKIYIPMKILISKARITEFKRWYEGKELFK